MTNILGEISAWSILKWVVIVLIAGFIGQFGKVMAQAVLGRIRRRATHKKDASGTAVQDTMAKKVPATAPGGAPPAAPAEGEDTPVPSDVHTFDTGRLPPADKKTLKTLAKIEKKAAKKGGKPYNDKS